MKLSETCLFALRLEIRCHAMFYLDLATREGNYYLADEPFEPDPYVWSLNHDVTMIEETMTIALPVNKLR